MTRKKRNKSRGTEVSLYKTMKNIKSSFNIWGIYRSYQIRNPVLNQVLNPVLNQAQTMKKWKTKEMPSNFQPMMTGKTEAVCLKIKISQTNAQFLFARPATGQKETTRESTKTRKMPIDSYCTAQKYTQWASPIDGTFTKRMGALAKGASVPSTNSTYVQCKSRTQNSAKNWSGIKTNVEEHTTGSYTSMVTYDYRPNLDQRKVQIISLEKP